MFLSSKAKTIQSRIRIAPAILSSALTRVLLVAGTFLLAACGESPVAPEAPIDRVAAARLLPGVTDARVRLTAGIENASIRERAVHDLRELESALTNGDGRTSRFHVRVIGSLLEDYRWTDIGRPDAPDLTAIALVLFQVSQLVDAGFTLTP
jgi:hypothetical protein